MFTLNVSSVSDGNGTIVIHCYTIVIINGIVVTVHRCVAIFITVFDNRMG